MLAVTTSGSLQGIEAYPVTVEVNNEEKGDPRMVIVGLPDAAVKESLDRVCSALRNSGFRLPQTRTTINLAPGDLRKEGPFFDLAIALGILGATGQLPPDSLPQLHNFIIAGELGLSGIVRPIKGALALAMMAEKQEKAGMLVPTESAEEATLVENIPVYPAKTLQEVFQMITGEIPMEATPPEKSSFRRPPPESQRLDFSEIKGQQQVRRAVEIAVAGGHNLLLIGPPGSGKSMIAKRIPSIMPEPTRQEFLEILSIHSAAGTSLKEENRFYQRPYRSPHHTISDVGLLGGGSIPGPGEISLAHHGVLFMDELPEFKRSALEVLRQPLEDAKVTISRSAGKITLPSAFMLVAAMNPCPCGYLGDSQRECRCTPTQVQRYRSRISGPLLDRIDLHIEAKSLDMKTLQSTQSAEPSASIRERIVNARQTQSDRFNHGLTSSNARMSQREIRTHCELNHEIATLLEKAMDELNLSARAYDRILKVARTIADINGNEAISKNDVTEAIFYRNLDRQLFY